MSCFAYNIPFALGAIFLPLVGKLCERYGRKLYFSLFSNFLLSFALLMMAFNLLSREKIERGVDI